MAKWVTSACCVIPPETQWKQIQDIRAKHDKAYERWPPHINMLYPFVHEREFKAAASKVEEALARVIKFTITLSKFSIFEHGKSCTVFLDPVVEPDDRLNGLYDVLEAAFPHCNDLRERGGGHFHGHLTVGQFKDSKTAKTQIAIWMKTWKPIVFEVDHVCLIARRGNAPFQVIHRVKLDTNKAPVAQAPAQQAPQYTANNLAESSESWQMSLFDDEPPRYPAVTYEEPVIVEHVQEHQVSVPAPSPISETRRDLPVRNARIPHPDGELGAVFKRIDSWLLSSRFRNKSQLPKTRPALLAATKNLRIMKERPLTGAQAALKLQEEQLISISGDSVEYLQKDEKAMPLPKHVDNPYGWQKSSEEKVLDRCRVWVRSPANSPKSLASLHRSLEQLCELRLVLDDANTLNMLADLDICRVQDDRDETVVYNL